MFPLTGCNIGRQDTSKPWGPVPGGGSGGSGAPRGFGGAVGEVDEETKKNQNIINIVREGQISLLVSGKHSDHERAGARASYTSPSSSVRSYASHCFSLLHLCPYTFFYLFLYLPIFLLSLPLQPHLAADNLELIRDEDGNNLLHISASQGHADCLQHLTSLMGEDGLNERNNQQLTPAGLGVKVSVCVHCLLKRFRLCCNYKNIWYFLKYEQMLKTSRPGHLD